MKELLNSNILITLHEIYLLTKSPTPVINVPARSPLIKIRLVINLIVNARRFPTCYQCNDHSIQVEEEHDKVESQFDETFLLVTVKSSKDFCGIKHMLSV